MQSPLFYLLWSVKTHLHRQCHLQLFEEFTVKNLTARTLIRGCRVTRNLRHCSSEIASGRGGTWIGSLYVLLGLLLVCRKIHRSGILAVLTLWLLWGPLDSKTLDTELGCSILSISGLPCLRPVPRRWSVSRQITVLVRRLLEPGCYWRTQIVSRLRIISWCVVRSPLASSPLRYSSPVAATSSLLENCVLTTFLLDPS